MTAAARSACGPGSRPRWACRAASCSRGRVRAACADPRVRGAFMGSGRQGLRARGGLGRRRSRRGATGRRQGQEGRLLVWVLQQWRAGEQGQGRRWQKADGVRLWWASPTTGNTCWCRRLVGGLRWLGSEHLARPFSKVLVTGAKMNQVCALVVPCSGRGPCPVVRRHTTPVQHPPCSSQQAPRRVLPVCV